MTTNTQSLVKPSTSLFTSLLTRTLDFGGPARTPLHDVEYHLGHPHSIGQQLDELVQVGEASRGTQYRIANSTSAVCPLFFQIAVPFKTDLFKTKTLVFCTFSIAIVGTTLSIFTFSQTHLAVQKALSLLVSVFGIILSTLKGALVSSLFCWNRM